VEANEGSGHNKPSLLKIPLVETIVFAMIIVLHNRFLDLVRGV